MHRMITTSLPIIGRCRFATQTNNPTRARCAFDLRSHDHKIYKVSNLRFENSGAPCRRPSVAATVEQEQQKLSSVLTYDGRWRIVRILNNKTKQNVNMTAGNCLCIDPLEPCWQFVFDEYDSEDDVKCWRRRSRRDDEDDNTILGSVEKVVQSVGVNDEQPNGLKRRKSFFRNRKEDRSLADEPLWSRSLSWDSKKERKDTGKERKGRALERSISFRSRAERELGPRYLQSNDELVKSRSLLTAEENPSSSHLRLLASRSADDIDLKRTRSRSRSRRSKSKARGIDTFRPVVERPKKDSNGGVYFVQAQPKHSTETFSIKEPTKPGRMSFFKRLTQGAVNQPQNFEEIPGRHGDVIGE